MSFALIEGYAAIFDVPDQNGDVIAPGAFTKTLGHKKPGDVKMLYQHAAEQPIGRWRSFHQDAYGLYAVGEINLASPRAAEIHTLLQGGALDGLSIGFKPLRSKKAKAPARRRLLEIDLWEVSIVTFPMAAGARVLNITCTDAAPSDPSKLLAKSLVKPLAFSIPGDARRASKGQRTPASKAAPPSRAGVRYLAEALSGAANILSQ